MELPGRDLYNQSIMSEPLLANNSLRTWPVLTGESLALAAPKEEPAKTDLDFRQLLATMLMGFSMPGSTDESGGLGNIIAPLMMTLVEQLLAQQVQSSSAGDAQASQEPQALEISASQSEPHGMPIKGRLTQSSHPGHVALDFGAPVGTKVHATMDGKVVYAGWNNEGYGNLVIVENGPYRTYFAHLSKIPVKIGQTVKAGELVGLSGNTGNSTGPHLHYEVRRKGKQINPTSFTLQ